MRRLLALFAILLFICLPQLATAQSPTPPRPGLGTPIGSLAADAQLYASPSLSAPARRIAAGSPILGLVARTEDGWLWVVTPSELGWLPPNAPLVFKSQVALPPLAPSSTAAAPTALPAVAPVAAPTAAPAAAVPPAPAATSAESATPWWAWAAILFGILLLAALVMLIPRSMLLRRQLSREEEKRASAEGQLRDLVQQSSEDMLLVDLNGQIIEANNQACRLVGRASLRGITLAELLGPETAATLLEEVLLMGVALREGLILRDAPTRKINLDARSVSHGGATSIRILLRDITDQQQMEDELLARRRELAALYDIATTASHSFDRNVVLGIALDRLIRIAGADAGGMFLRANGSVKLWTTQGFSPTFNRRVGGAAEEGGLLRQVTQSAAPWILPTMPSPTDSLGQALAEEGVASLAVVPLLAHGEGAGTVLLAARRPQAFDTKDIPLFEVIGAQIGVAIKNARLFQELGETVQRLDDTKLFSESVFQNMTNGLITIDAAGRITSVNRAAQQMLGLTPAAVVGQPLIQVLDTPDSLSGMISQVLRLGTTFAGFEIVLTRLDGREVPLRQSLAPLRNDEGRIVGAVLVFDDLSEQRSMEEERQRLDRLALLGEMSAIIAHEIRNPLAAISTGIQYLLEQIPPGDPAYTTLTLIRQENERLNQLLEDVLLMSRPPRLQAVCSITHILDDVLGRAHATAALNQIRIVRQFSPDTPTVRGDATRLEQAMSNLIANAIQAMPEGGILNVRTRKDTARGGDGALQMMPERMLSAASGPWAVIEIEDTGVGIPNGDLPRIFSPFFTTKRSGTGLGLTITQRIVGEHGGEVAVNSDPGRGTLFTVRLPAAV
ncbi:MAG: PAS domain S-box protein [Anaerolineae bacterium]